MKFVGHKENFCNFVFGEHSDYCLYYFVIEHYKGTTIFANHQIYRQLYFIELTLFMTYQVESQLCFIKASIDDKENPAILYEMAGLLYEPI